ncbi:MAG: polyphosphate kinase 1 [Succinivibrio sp.]|nr:polyphosphate kinase 1 [Succinivibrio sp.]
MAVPFMPKELSWLSFNARVLQEAADPSVPLIERVRFLGIYANNQDEFFKVRVAELKKHAIINRDSGSDNEQVVLLRKVQQEADRYQQTLNEIFRNLLNELASHSIYLKDETEISAEQRQWVEKYFRQEVLKHINPVIIDENTDLVEFLLDKYTYLFVKMTGEEANYYALIEIPTDQVPRFVKIPSDDHSVTFMFLDNVIRIGLDLIFKNLFTYRSIEAYSIKMNRDAEFDLSGNVDKSILVDMSESLKQRLNANPVRFAYDAAMPPPIVKFMAQELNMSAIDSLMPGNRYHNFKDFISFPASADETMQYQRFSVVPSCDFDSAQTPFDAISRRDILLYYPYYSFDYLTEFLRQASYDPKVTSIKINIYRVASESRVINSLIDAANNGKSVTVVVELKARFDEANNIKWASRLTDSGVKVHFGLPTLKIHSKLCLVTRKENDKLVRYAHIGTGNFNEKTARIYTDFALFTANPALANEVEGVFEFIEYPYTRPNFRYLLVSPLNARDRLTAMVDREIAYAQDGRDAYIHLKINNLVDEKLVNKLYEASQAGVRIRAVIRGMCTLRPGVKGLSENIYITSIVDRFLEHPRVMIFGNGGQEELYISSADWMTRNLDYRIEVGAPVLDQRLRDRIKRIVMIQESDNRKARIIDAEQQNDYVRTEPGTPKIRSQMAIREYLEDVERESAAYLGIAYPAE